MDFKKLDKKVRLGNPVSDAELNFLIVRYQTIRESLLGTGDIFYLALAEANRSLGRLQDYRRARDNHA